MNTLPWEWIPFIEIMYRPHRVIKLVVKSNGNQSVEKTICRTLYWTRILKNSGCSGRILRDWGWLELISWFSTLYPNFWIHYNRSFDVVGHPLKCKIGTCKKISAYSIASEGCLVLIPYLEKRVISANICKAASAVFRLKKNVKLQIKYPPEYELVGTKIAKVSRFSFIWLAAPRWPFVKWFSRI